MLLGNQQLSMPALTSCVCNRPQPPLISPTISHFLLCQHLICLSQAYCQPPMPPAAQPPSPALGVPEPHRSSSGGAEPVFVQRIGPVCSLMHWQTVYTCLIGAGVCCAYRAKGLSATIRTLTGLALFSTAASHPQSYLGGRGGHCLINSCSSKGSCSFSVHLFGVYTSPSVCEEEKEINNSCQ